MINVPRSPIAARMQPAEWALRIAETVALRADCTRRQVGAVVLDVDRRVIGVGYNGAAPGEPGCLTEAGCPRGALTHEELPPDSAYTGHGVAAPCTAIHAEENALMYSDPVRRKGGTMAVSAPPCPGCKRLLMGSGLSRVFWRSPTDLHGLIQFLPPTIQH